MSMDYGIDSRAIANLNFEPCLTHRIVLMQMNTLSFLVFAALVASTAAYKYAHDGYGTVSGCESLVCGLYPALAILPLSSSSLPVA